MIAQGLLTRMLEESESAGGVQPGTIIEMSKSAGAEDMAALAFLLADSDVNYIARDCIMAVLKNMSEPRAAAMVRAYQVTRTYPAVYPQGRAANSPEYRLNLRASEFDNSALALVQQFSGIANKSDALKYALTLAAVVLADQYEAGLIK